MQPFHTTLLCSCLLALSPVSAAEETPVQRYPSPKGDLVLLVQPHPEKPDKVWLEGVSGKLFLTLAVEDDLKQGEIKEGSILWSAGSDAVAFAVGNPQHLDTHVFVRTKEVWKDLKLPKPNDEKGNPLVGSQSVPAKWQGNVLSLTISGPSPTGAAATPSYSGSMSVAIDIEAGTAKKVEEKIEAVSTKKSE
ncbi:hypothetical protein [Haloferula sp. BvORR071]|uniref:hypothetical protein n=1 Tax=Haloferula sp. BvORR071 TaxID=1396141 RepID=UPI0005560D2F|nr:hypothetical protein [Haloferula sp. BvORR071]